ncbi:OmpH family outer membrane protein [Candidatus Palauibacter sp.]|uniref:OmpH family outer membrane protein n=1 Tax=Candidatus Palauibacter sp. TaxID=3101350 RepID=UPI003AF2F06A
MHWIHRGAFPAVIRGLALGLLVAAPVGAQQQAGAPSLPGAAPLPPEGTTLVFVNTQAILPIAPGADSAQAAFLRVSTDFDRELEGLAAEIDSLLTAYQQQESLLDPAGRQQKQQEILAKREGAAARQQELIQESERRRTELLAPILERITQVIEDLRAERSYSIVLDITESGVVAADASLDITGAVLERLGVDIPASASGG